MAGPIPSFVPGTRSMIASAMTCAAEWRMAPSSSWAPASSSSSADPRSGASRTSSATWIASSLIVTASGESQNPSSIDRTRGSLPRSHPPSQATPVRSGVALTGDSRAGSPAAHGWCLEDPIAGISAWLCSPVPALCGSSLCEVRPDRRCVRDVVGDTGLEPVTSCMSSRVPWSGSGPPASVGPCVNRTRS